MVVLEFHVSLNIVPDSACTEGVVLYTETVDHIQDGSELTSLFLQLQVTRNRTTVKYNTYEALYGSTRSTSIR